MKKILIYTPDPLDGVSYYRQWGPMSMMHDRYQLASFSNRAEEVTHWTWFLNYDVVLMGRPYRVVDLYFVQQCKKFGLPVWFDFDDALFNIPPDNPVYETFSGEQSREIMRQCLQLADCVTVGSELQKEQMIKELELKNVINIPIALDDRLLRHAKPFPKNQKRRYAWRGSQSHLTDLLKYQDAYTKLHYHTRENEWVYFGIHPFWLEWDIPRVNFKYAKPANLIDFHMSLANWNPHILTVPLVDHYFNRVKGHLSWIDATLAGSVALCPNFPEHWDKPGMLNYAADSPNCVESFYHAFIKLDGYTDEKLDRMHREAREWQCDNILLSRVNSLREEIIENLTPKRSVSNG